MKRIKELLITGGTKTEDLLFVEVTVRHIYVFNYNKKHKRCADGRTPESLIQEFFVDFDINRGHVSRDVSEVGGAKTIKKIRYAVSGINPKNFPLKKKT